MVMQNPERAVTTLNRLREMGISVSIDDFGTGYSSLGYLKRFPIDNVKVDRSFIKDLPHDTDDAAITRAVIAMAHSLRIRVVAEGVETLEQLQFLRDHNCDECQGFYMSRPLPASEFALLVRGWQRDQIVDGRLRPVHELVPDAAPIARQSRSCDLVLSRSLHDRLGASAPCGQGFSLAGCAASVDEADRAPLRRRR